MRIGLFLKYLDEEYQSSVYAGVREAARRLGIQLVCVQGETFEHCRDPGATLFPALAFLRLDGILLLSSIIVDQANPPPSPPAGLEGRRIVSIGAELFGWPSVLVDAAEAFDSLLDHLIEDHGYRSFLYLGGPATNADSREREFSVLARIDRERARGLPCSVTVMRGDLFSESAGVRMAREYLAGHASRDVDAIVAGSDDIALGARKFLRAAREPLWADCPITGFDDIPHARFARPGLTTVRQPLAELGAASVGALARMSRGEAVPRRTLIPAAFVRRASCGCPDAVDPAPARPGNDALQEQFLRDAGYLAQSLMAATDRGGIVGPLEEFLSSVEVPRIFLIAFPRPLATMPDEATLLHARGECPSRAGDRVALAPFFESVLPSLNSGFAGVLIHLRAAEGEIGLLYYEAEDDVHPFMSLCASFLSAALARLNLLEDERTRALELEREVLRISDLERLRFSVDLHDDICQSLAAMMMVAESLGGDDPRARMLAAMAADTLERTRRYARDSFPVDIDAVSLADSLRALVEAMDGQGGCSFRFVMTGDGPEPFSRAERVNLYRIAQEALQNVSRHSRAREAVVSLSLADAESVLRVGDDGQGDPAIDSRAERNAGPRPDRSRGRRPRGIGLKSMEYRSRQIGASFAVSSSAGGGTSVEVRVPRGRIVK